MGVADIVAAIRAETDAEIERRRAATDARVDRLMKGAAEQAAEIRREVEASRDAVARRDAGRIVNRAALEADRAARAAVEEVFQDAVAELVERLRTIRTSRRYPAMFATGLRDALADLPDATHVEVDSRDLDLARRVVSGLDHAPAVDPTLDCWGGFVVTTDDGRSVINTLEDRLARAADLLRLVAAVRVWELGEDEVGS